MVKAQPVMVAIIDHDKDFLKNILTVLRKEKDIRVCASHVITNYVKESTVVDEIENEVIHLKPRVVLLSQMVLREAAAMHLEVLMQIRDNIQKMQTIVTVDHYAEEAALIGIREGIRGLYMRKLGTSQIVACVRAVAAGGVWFEPRMISRVFDEFSKLYKHVDSLQSPTKVNQERLSLLSPREMEILGLISKSYTNANIAKTLFISEETVRTHIRNMFEKTGVKNRVEAMLLLVRSGLAS